MGMFDWVQCRRVMPDGLDGTKHTFQSKDLDCSLDTLEITEDGRLVQHRDDDRERSDRVIDFHGRLNFYTGVGDVNSRKDYRWHEYEAKFTDGRLVEIVTLTSRWDEKS